LQVKSTDAALQMLNDELSFGVVREVVVSEDGAVVELRQTVDADLMSLNHVKQVLQSQPYKFINSQLSNRIESHGKLLFE